MPTINSLQELLVEQLKDLYDAEKRLTKALPKMAKKATHQELVAAIEEHLSETEGHVQRLEQMFEMLEEPVKSKPCAGIRGILEEGDEHVGEDYNDDGLRDAVIIGSAQRVEHYEMAAYGTAAAHAKRLGLDEIAELLDTTLAEEKAADEKLTEIAETVVNADAAEAEGKKRTDDDEETAAVGAGASRGRDKTARRDDAASSDSTRGRSGKKKGTRQ